MHEHSLIANLLNKIETIARGQDASKVTTVRVRLGALSNISPGHFREHFENETVGTIAEGALLEIVTAPAEDTYSPNALDILLESIDVAE